jgi:hypothetical protein
MNQRVIYESASDRGARAAAWADYGIYTVGKCNPYCNDERLNELDHKINLSYCRLIT